ARLRDQVTIMWHWLSELREGGAAGRSRPGQAPGRRPTRPALEVLEDRFLLAASVAPVVPAVAAQPTAATTAQAVLADSFSVLAQNGQAAVTAATAGGVQGSVSALAFTQAGSVWPVPATPTPALPPGGA